MNAAAHTIKMTFWLVKLCALLLPLQSWLTIMAITWRNAKAAVTYDCPIVYVRTNGRVKLMRWFSIEPLNEPSIRWWFVSFVLLSICMNCTIDQRCDEFEWLLTDFGWRTEYVNFGWWNGTHLTSREDRRSREWVHGNNLSVISKRIANHFKMIHCRARESFLRRMDAIKRKKRKKMEYFQFRRIDRVDREVSR